MHQSTTPSLLLTIRPRWASRQFLSLPIVQTLLPVTFSYSLSPEAVVMRQLMKWKRLWRRSLTRSQKRTSMGPSRSCCNCRTSALQPEEITSKGNKVSCVYYQLEVLIRKKSGNLFNHPRIYIYIERERARERERDSERQTERERERERERKRERGREGREGGRDRSWCIVYKYIYTYIYINKLDINRLRLRLTDINRLRNIYIYIYIYIYT